MNNPWQDLFNTWLDSLGTEKNEMKKYEVKFRTIATTSVFVDAMDEDEACDIACDMIDEGEVSFDEWEVTDVERDYD